MEKYCELCENEFDGESFKYIETGQGYLISLVYYHDESIECEICHKCQIKIEETVKSLFKSNEENK